MHGDGQHIGRSPRMALVTGVAGFIGSHLAEALVASGWQVRGVDAFTDTYEPSRKRANLVEVRDHAAFSLVEADLATSELASVLDGVDVVFHLAGEPGVVGSWGAEFAGYVHRNLLATQRLLDAAVRAGVRRLVYASSSSVYGDAAAVPTPEDAPLQPASPYGVTKLGGEQLLSAYAREFGLPVVSLRYFSVYGPRQRPDMAVHRFVVSALGRTAIPLSRDGRQVRDLTFVEDVVEATLAAATAPLADRSILNVAGGAPVTMAHVVEHIGDILGAGPLAIAKIADRPGDVECTAGDITRTRELLGWEPRTTLPDGLARQVAWHREQRPRRRAQRSVAARRGGRVLVYSQDGFGLGHLRRTNHVAAALLRRRPDWTVLSAVDSPLGQFFDTPPNHEFLKLPSLVKAGPGRWFPPGMPVPTDDVRTMRRELLLSTARTYKPDVLLVDHMPGGAMGELVPALEALRANGTRMVLGLRDVLDSPSAVSTVWHAENTAATVDAYYDEVLVYGSQDVFDVADEYELPAEVQRRLRYCGYVSGNQPARYTHRLRHELLDGNPAEAGLLVVMAGGGADSYPVHRAVLDALPSIRLETPCVTVLVTGPFLPAVLRRDIVMRARALGPGVHVRRSVSDTLSYLEAADAVVAMAGYNTSVEILRTGTPAVLVPRSGPSAEQQIRAALFASRGWVRACRSESADTAGLASLVLDALAGPGVPPATFPDLGGADAAAACLTGSQPNRDSSRLVPASV